MQGIWLNTTSAPNIICGILLFVYGDSTPHPIIFYSMCWKLGNGHRWCRSVIQFAKYSIPQIHLSAAHNINGFYNLRKPYNLTKDVVVYLTILAFLIPLSLLAIWLSIGQTWLYKRLSMKNRSMVVWVFMPNYLTYAISLIVDTRT